MLPRITLKPKREAALRRCHPWIFSGAIDRKDPEIKAGDTVEVFSSVGDFLAVGHFAEASIAVKIIAFNKVSIDSLFWSEKIRSAISLRRRIGLFENPETNAFRLINAEGDALPGLIVDLYANTAVIQCHSIGMYNARKEIAAALVEALPERIEAVFDKSAESLHSKQENGYLFGQDSSNLVVENGFKFKVDWKHGQKTGFFLDQRENRALLKRYAQNCSVLNAFSYSGGFTVYALGAGAKSVDSVDSSKPALELLKENITLNFTEEVTHKSIDADCFEFLKSIDSRYDLIILDPPAFAKGLSAVKAGMRGYETINSHALKGITQGGLLFTFSCSQAISREMFREVVSRSAVNSRRSVKILHELHQAPCHALNPNHPEGEYLKGLVLAVD